MRLSLLIALLALWTAAPAATLSPQARVDMPCGASQRTCDCSWYVRDCIPTCRIEPPIECAPPFVRG